MGVSEDLREFANPPVELQHLFDQHRNTAQVPRHAAEPLVVDRAAQPADGQGDHSQHGDLAREGLRRGDADLRAHVDVAPRVGGARNGRSDHVADAEDEGPLPLGELQRRQRVGRLARLRYGDQNVAFADDRMAVAELAGILHLDGYAAELFEEVLSDQSGVPRRAAGHDDDAPGLQKALPVFQYARDRQPLAVGRYAAADAVCDGFGLLENLLEHEVRVASLLQFGDAHLELGDVDLRLAVVAADDAELLVAVDDGDLSVVEVDYLVGELDDGRGVGGEVVGFGARDADHQRTAPAGSDDLVRILAVDDGDGVGADDPVRGLPHRFEERASGALHHVFDQLHQHLRVRFAPKVVSVLPEGLLEHVVVLDGAVVDQGDASRLRAVGMGVRVVRFAVGGPAGVGDADRAAELLRPGEALQLVHLAFRFVNPKLAARVDQSDARAVVTSIFQPVKPLNEDRVGFPISDVSDDSAHVCLRFLRLDNQLNLTCLYVLFGLSEPTAQK